MKKYHMTIMATLLAASMAGFAAEDSCEAAAPPSIRQQGDAGKKEAEAKLAKDWGELKAGISRDDAEGVRRLLEAGLDPDLPPRHMKREKALFTAVFFDSSPEVFQALLEHGADVNAVDSQGNTPLMTCRRAKTAKWLLEHGAKADARSCNGEFALMLCADAEIAGLVYEAAPWMLYMKDYAGNTPLIKVAESLYEGDANMLIACGISSGAHSQDVLDFLLKKGADPSAANKAGVTALMRAAKNGNMHAVQALLDAGADAAPQDSQGKSALDYAMESGCFEIAALLETYGATVGYNSAFVKAAAAGRTRVLRNLIAKHSLKVKDCGWVAMEAAAMHGHAETAQMLADAGVSPDSRDVRRQTLLYRAAGRRDVRAAKILLDIGANPNLETYAPFSAGRLPLHAAAKQGDLAMAQLLLARGSRLDLPGAGRYGENALADAVHGGNGEVLKALLAAGADKNALFAAGCYELNPQTDLVKILLDAGADPNLNARCSGMSPLDSAMRQRCYDTAMLLLQYGADADETDNYNRNRLYSAACSAPEELVAELLKRGARVNLVDTVPQHRQSALICAVAVRKQDSPEIVRLLLEAGAYPAVRDAKGKTALDYAREKGFGQSAALLQARQ